MEKRIDIIAFITGICVYLFSAVQVFADSSWIWISETRPYDLLPVVIIITLVVEIFAINYWAEVHRILKTCVVVTIANLSSFLIPYWITVYVDGVHTYPDTLNDYHSIVVGLYMLITLLIELPVVMLLLRKDTDNKKKLFWTTFLSNVTTTIMVFIIEQIFCKGYYA